MTSFLDFFFLFFCVQRNVLIWAKVDFPFFLYHFVRAIIWTIRKNTRNTKAMNQMYFYPRNFYKISIQVPCSTRILLKPYKSTVESLILEPLYLEISLCRTKYLVPRMRFQAKISSPISNSLYLEQVFWSLEGLRQRDSTACIFL